DEYRWIIERSLPRPAQGVSDDNYISVPINVTPRKLAVEALRETDQLHRDMAESACDWFWEMDAELRLTYLSARFFEIFAVRPEDVIGKTRMELAGADVESESWRRHLLDLENRRAFRNFSYSLNLDGQRRRYIVISGKPVFNADGEFIGYRGTGTDKTDEVETRLELEKANKETSFLLEELRTRQEQLSEQNRRLDAALDNMSQGLCMFDKDKRLVICNQKYLSMYDLPAELGAPGTEFRKILEYRINSGVYSGDDPEGYIRERLKAVEDREPSTKIQELNDGRSLAITHQPLPDGGWLATHEDITELQRVQAKITHMALHDALTDLPNRELLRERIDQQLGFAKRGHGFAIVCLDLDRFKTVNETLGHPVGDELLIAVAERIRGCVREHDIVARLGGDEFAVLQASHNQPNDARRLAARLCEVLSEPISLSNHQVAVGASVGIALAPADGRDAVELLKNA
ncbi:MAG: diguanylate cyclase, partial [Alphaproteobacteria bacterium]